jgi:hypothetical protein
MRRSGAVLLAVALVLFAFEGVATASSKPSGSDVASATVALRHVLELIVAADSDGLSRALVPAQRRLLDSSGAELGACVPNLTSLSTYESLGLTSKIGIKNFAAKPSSNLATKTVPGTDVDARMMNLQFKYTMVFKGSSKSKTGSGGQTMVKTAHGWAWLLTQSQLDQCLPTDDSSIDGSSSDSSSTDCSTDDYESGVC